MMGFHVVVNVILFIYHRTITQTSDSRICRLILIYWRSKTATLAHYLLDFSENTTFRTQNCFEHKHYLAALSGNITVFDKSSTSKTIQKYTVHNVILSAFSNKDTNRLPFLPVWTTYRTFEGTIQNIGKTNNIVIIYFSPFSYKSTAFFWNLNQCFLYRLLL